MKLKVGVVGAGSWGTTVAALVTRNAPVTLWARQQTVTDEINEQRTNSRYLPDARLPEQLLATSDLEEAVADKDVIVMGVPSHGFRSVLEQVAEHIRPWVPVVSLTKGLELPAGKRMSEIVEEILPGHPFGMLTGPNLAREIMAGYSAASVIAMQDVLIVKELQKLFHSGLFRVYSNHDVIGCELGGVLKNIIAIAAGMGDGQSAGDNTRAAIISRGLAEITRLGVAMGGEAQTFAGLAGLGDLIATATSPQSRNRTVGYELGRGRTIKEITEQMFMVAEGVKSAPAVIALADEYGVEMPISRDVYKVVAENGNPRHAFRGLLRQAAGAESDPG
ncbi:NAD(P)H-dependent glycerol-3-phosphate dehydrogenase [Lentisalinibacter sediminis]|uniref:NAD(P)H-dependent glycerol-3-phosphate dehydrogenase n=1 Tax=Lentisalinibacter sediminis TaxID=2992237 RepID=UPI00386B4A80